MHELLFHLVFNSLIVFPFHFVSPTTSSSLDITHNSHILPHQEPSLSFLDIVFAIILMRYMNRIVMCNFTLSLLFFSPHLSHPVIVLILLSLSYTCLQLVFMMRIFFRDAPDHHTQYDTISLSTNNLIT